MLKPEELRIGNYIIVSSHINGGYVTKTESFDSMNEFFNLYSPIPITEEWLVKFGFKKDSDKLSLQWLKAQAVWLRKPEIPSSPLILDKEGRYMACGREVSNIHSLQNLYYALTGIELELKQEVKK